MLASLKSVGTVPVENEVLKRISNGFEITDFRSLSMSMGILMILMGILYVNGETAIGLPAESSMEGVKLFDHLTSQVQQLLADVKKFQNRNGFCWSKNFIVYNVSS